MGGLATERTEYETCELVRELAAQCSARRARGRAGPSPGPGSGAGPALGDVASTRGDGGGELLAAVHRALYTGAGRWTLDRDDAASQPCLRLCAFVTGDAAVGRVRRAMNGAPLEAARPDYLAQWTAGAQAVERRPCDWAAGEAVESGERTAHKPVPANA